MSRLNFFLEDYNGGKLIAVGTRDELRKQSGAAGALEEIFLSLTAEAK